MIPTNLLTVAAVAAHFGLLPNSPIFAGPSPEPVTEDDLRSMTYEELARSVRQHDKLIDAIKSDGDTTERAQRRLDDALQSRAVFAAEMEERPEHHETRAQHDARASGGTGRRTGPDMPQREAPNADAASRRMGVLLRDSKSPSAAIFGSVPTRTAGTSSEWRNADEFFLTLANRVSDPRLIAAATSVEGTGTDGGYIVPREWYRGVIDSMFTGSEFAQRCRLFGTSSNNLSIPILDAANRTSTIAGVRGNWVAENSQQTPQALKFKMVDLKLHKVMILGEGSNELLSDGVGFAAYMQAVMSENSAVTLDDAILNGTGVGQPLGILNSPSAIEVAADSAQTQDTVTYSNLVNLYSRVHPTCQRRGVWFYTPGMLPQLLQMTIPDTDGRPVLLSGGPNDAAAGSPAQTIFGRPAYASEHMPQLGDAGDIVFVDFSQYALLMKDGARIDSTDQYGFDRDATTWRLRLRAHGQPLWPEAITPRNGGSTLSWATYLAARAG